MKNAAMEVEIEVSSKSVNNSSRLGFNFDMEAYYVDNKYEFNRENFKDGNLS
jgi:hypothetical protein